MLPYPALVLQLQHLPVMLRTKPKTWNHPQPVRDLCQLKSKEMVSWDCIIFFCYVDWPWVTDLLCSLSDTAVPASTAEPSTCNAVSRAKALKQPVTSHRAALPKPQSHGKLECWGAQMRHLRPLEVLIKHLMWCVFALFYNKLHGWLSALLRDLVVKWHSLFFSCIRHLPLLHFSYESS